MNVQLMIGVAVIAFSLACVFCFARIVLIKWQKDKLQYLASQSSLNKLRQEFLLLSRSQEIISEFEAEYFPTLVSNRYTELVGIKDALSESIDTCQFLLDQGRYSELKELLAFLYVSRGRGTAPALLNFDFKGNLDSLLNWGERSKEILCNLSNKISETSNSLREFGSEQRRARKKTEMLLAEAVAALRTM